MADFVPTDHSFLVPQSSRTQPYLQLFAKAYSLIRSFWYHVTLDPFLRLGNLINKGRLVAVVGVTALIVASGTAARGVHALERSTLLAFGHGSHLLGVLEGVLSPLV